MLENLCGGGSYEFNYKSSLKGHKNGIKREMKL